ncbi:MAG: FtsX-like permease family protein, partial [Candidatus Thorarchaeota archaeon]
SSLRTTGIALMLAISVALPATVFTWSNTGIWITVQEYFEDNTYQVRIGHSFMATPDTNLLYISYLNEFREDQAEALEYAKTFPFVERVDFVPTTIGLLSAIENQSTVPSNPNYWMWNTVYAMGFKDCRVIVVNNELLGRWSNEFEFQGDFSLRPGEVLVSEDFVKYTKQVHGLDIIVGSSISVNICRNPDYHYYGTLTPEYWNQHTERNVTVAGIYRIKSLRSLISEVFPSLTRINWDPFAGGESVLGIADSVMFHEDSFTDIEMEELYEYGIFYPAGLIRGDTDKLMELGPEKIADNFQGFMEQVISSVPDTQIYGTQNINDLQQYIDNFITSRGLIILSFPVLFMSVMLTVYISDLSIQKRRENVRIVRSKGASYNQVLSSMMWEAMILTGTGIIAGILLSLILSPMMGSAIGLLVFNTELFIQYIEHLRPSLVGIIIGGFIAMYLPGGYLLQIARKLDVSEIGIQKNLESDDIAESPSIRKPGLLLFIIIAGMLILPFTFEPSGIFVYLEIIIVTLLLFAATYFGSFVMRKVTSSISGISVLVMGEKQAYVRQSLKRRKGQFLPLFIILTLTLTMSIMTLIQVASFESTVESELEFSIGADIRIETKNIPLSYNQTLYRYSGVRVVTSVVETTGQIATSTFFVEGINPLDYLKVGIFRNDCFVNGTPESVMQTLANTEQGIVISEYYSEQWNKTVGDSVYLQMDGANSTVYGNLRIVGIARSAPGFGLASTEDMPAESFAAQFGFQAAQGGFVLVNQDFLIERTGIQTPDMFLIDMAWWAQDEHIIASLDALPNFEVYTSSTFDYSEAHNVFLFLTAFNGVSSVIILISISLGLASIGFFLSSDISDRNREYAILRALGASKDQVVSLAFGEFSGIVLSSAGIGLVLGALFGYTFSLVAIGVAPFATVFPVQLSFPIISIEVVFLVELLVMILSCYAPARKVGSVEPAAVLRNL